MKNNLIFLCISVLFVFILGVSSISSSYADHTNVNVNIANGSSVPGCEENNTCFNSSLTTIDILSKVTWKNSDSVAHTVTSTNPTVESDNIFDSGLIMSGDSFSKKFENVGTFDYACTCNCGCQNSIAIQSLSELPHSKIR